LRKKSIDLNKATEELRLANQQLRQMDEMKDEFLYTVTHEIRTPLTSIRAMAEILHDHSDMEEDKRQHFLASIIREIERLSHLITQVLNLERFENGKNRLQLVSVDLNEIVRDSMAAFSVMASETKTELVSQIPDSMHLLRCDQNLIRQVLDNLLSNAFKALPAADRKIVVSLYENQEEITVTVEDNGKGIPKELHELVYDKFFQAKNQTLKKPEGSGLGLSICKKIIELHGGKIWVVSDIEKGAKFAFTLPTLITHEEDPYS
ncbi:MAG: HAMP domain-containing histidine kinase, partial [Saprospiraceae bacterium]|nr:HAMP domain-containing histidine kinase [Saprospiraceae bacterium]